MKIKILSMAALKIKLEEEKNIYNDIVTGHTGIISIRDSNLINEPLFKETEKNILQLVFDDIDAESEEDEIFYKNYNKKQIPTKEHITAIKTFLKETHPNLLLIHCHAGISRSGATGIIAGDYYNGRNGINMVLDDNPHIRPNAWMLKLANIVI